MGKAIFPEGQAIFKDKPYSKEFFALTLEEIDSSGDSFMGMIRIDEPGSSFFLFFLRGDAYAAGCIKDDKPIPLSIKEFLEHLAVSSEQRTLSLYKTDPVLLKEMLIFLQKEPLTTGSISDIGFRDIINMIKMEAASALVVLKKGHMHSFFYFHAGAPKMAHYADAPDIDRNISVAEQMFSLASPTDNSPVDALIYRDIATSEAADTGEIKPSLISDALKNERKPASVLQEEPSSREEKSVRVRIEITEGPQKGTKFNIPLPLTIGRRDATIRIRDMTMSSRHASVEAIGNSIIFKDLGSTNSSMVNGIAVKEKELSDGDVIRMGCTTVKINFVLGE